MARTISPDYDKRRHIIVENAARLYAKSGFLGASVADLAKACDMSKSLIYHYYPSKEDILFAVMSAHLDDLEEVLAGDDRGAAPEDRLRELTRGFMVKYAGAAPSQKVLLNELDNVTAESRPKIIQRQRKIIKKVEALLIAILPPLGEAAALQRPVTMLYFGMINWTHTWYRSDGAVSPSKLADLAVDLFMKGLPALRVDGRGV